MSRRGVLGALAVAAVPSALATRREGSAASHDFETVRLGRTGRYETGEALGGAEIVSYHAPENRLFVVNSGAGQVEVLDLSDPANPTQDDVLDASDVAEESSTRLTSAGGTNSVAVDDGVVAAAVEADPATGDGVVAFYGPSSLEFKNAVRVGPLPDKVTISPDGNYVVVANEGEPGASGDPAGSVSVVDISDGVSRADVTTATFTEFDGQEESLREEGVHLVSQGSGSVTASNVIEPEYVTITPDSGTAFVSLQENNAIATVDLESGTVTDIEGLGFKDFSLPGNELDTSDADASSLQSWPLEGMYQPDAIDSYEVAGETFVVTANEGDAKDFEVGILKNLSLDADAFELSEYPGVDSVADLKKPEHLGNMEVNEAAMAEFADDDGDGSYSEIYAIGGRSFSIWHHGEDGLDLAFDSGNDFEKVFAQQYPEGHVNTVESGPETESVELGKVGDRMFAFVGQEVGSGIATYDVTAPESPDYVGMSVNRDYSVSEDDIENDPEDPGRAGDFAPEGVHFVPAGDSPVANPLVCVGYEISGTVGVFEVEPVTEAN